MAIFSLFEYNQSNRIDVRIGDGTVKITTILTVRAMLTFKKNTVEGQEINRGRGQKQKSGGQCPPRWRRAYDEKSISARIFDGKMGNFYNNIFKLYDEVTCKAASYGAIIICD